MQRPTESCSTSMRQPWPAISGAANDGIDRNEHIVAAHRPVLKRDIEREMPAAGLDPRRIAGEQCAGDAKIHFAAEQLLRIEHAERQADDRGHRRQRDVALGEIEPETQHLLSLPLTTADYAGVGERGGIGADARTGERKAGDVHATRQAWQVIFFCASVP